MKSQRNYGWIPDLPDQRDQTFTIIQSAVPLPAKVDLRPGCPPVYDQGQLGSCTANAIAAALEFGRKKQKLADFVPSRLFIYYNERVMEGTVSSDSGAMIRDGIKSVAKQGDCPETEWPYNIQSFKKKPTVKCYTDALKYKAVTYQRITPGVTAIQSCLAAGLPFVFGFTVYESFESQAVADTGVVSLPKHGEKVLGGHAVMAVGYDQSKGTVLVRNSWGPGWGMAGYFTMPITYLTNSNLADDFWQVSVVT